MALNNMYSEELDEVPSPKPARLYLNTIAVKCHLMMALNHGLVLSYDIENWIRHDIYTLRGNYGCVCDIDMLENMLTLNETNKIGL